MKNFNSLIISVCEKHGLQYINAMPVSGGDINASYKVETDKGIFFCKLNEKEKFPLMFAKEAEGLDALRKVTSLKVPQVFSVGEIEDQQYLLLEWIEKAVPAKDFWVKLAEGITQLHKTSSKTLGWTSYNYIGSLRQENEQKDNWEEFYASQRIIPLVKMLIDMDIFAKADLNSSEKLCKKLTDFFPVENPSLLHGDFWSGNFMVANDNGKSMPVIYDPAVYFGHREMDIGMSVLFGGFDKKLYEAYHEIFPLAPNWKERIPLTQLYPLLVHALLFRGSYVKQCRDIIYRFS